jgi:hypothetical protein
MVDQVSTTSMMMAEQHKVQQINETSNPREGIKATYMDEDRPRLLQRSESMRILDHHQNPSPTSFRRQNSSRKYQHHRDYQSNDSRFFNDNDRVGNSNNSNSNNNITHNPTFHEGSNRLPPRPPLRFSSYQPNSRPKYQSTAPIRTFQPNSNKFYPVEGSYPSSISSRDHERPALQRKASGLHGRPTLQRKDSGYHGRPTLQRRASGLHGHHGRPSLQRKDSGYRFVEPLTRTTTTSGNPQGGDRVAQPRQQYRRSNSLPMSSLENLHSSSSSRPQLNRASSMMYRKGPSHPSVNNRSKRRVADSNSNSNSNSIHNKFAPQKSTSIYRRFDKQKEVTDQDDDIWVERIIVNGISGRRTYFKSVYGNVIRKEPPTGAGAIIYLEDIIDERRQVELPKERSLQQQQQQQQQQQPQVDIQQQQQQIEILSLKTPSSFEKNDNEALSKTNEDEGDGKTKQKQPKRRAGFFGFMRKKRKNKTKSDVK